MQSFLLSLFLVLFALNIDAQVIWSGAVSNDWGTADNWDPRQIPGPSSDVLISGTVVASPSYNISVRTLTLNDGVVTFNTRLEVTTSISINGGTSIAFNRDAVVKAIFFNVGSTSFSIGNSGVLNITDAFTWGTGNTISITNSNRQNGGRINFLSSCKSSLQANTATINYVTITNFGIFNYFSSANAVLNLGAQFINARGAIFSTVQSANAQFSSTGVLPFINRGIFYLQIPQSNSFTFSATMQNEGIINVTSGSLRLLGASSSHSGVFFTNTTAGSSILFLGTGSQNFITQAPFVNGPGVVFSGPSTININSPNFTSSFQLENYQLFFHTGGQIVLQSSCVTNVVSPDASYSSIIITNFGVVNYLGATITFLNRSKFVNAPGAFFYATGSSDMNWNDRSANTAMFINQGTFELQLQGNAFTFYPVFQNDGLLQVSSGTLILNGGGATHTGSYQTNATAGAVIRFAGAVEHTFATSRPFSNGLGLEFVGPFVYIASENFTSSFTLKSGIVLFSIPFNSVPNLTSHIINWIGGDLYFYENAVIGSLIIGGSSNSTLFLTNTLQLNIIVSLNWNSQVNVTTLSSQSGGIINLQRNSVNYFTSSSPSFVNFVDIVNYGTINYQSSAGIYLSGGRLLNARSGSFVVNGENTTSIGDASGDLSTFINEGIILVNFTMLDDQFLVFSTLQNNGVIQVISGEMIIAGAGTIHRGSFLSQTFQGGAIQFIKSDAIHQFVPTLPFISDPGLTFDGVIANIDSPNFAPSFKVKSGVVNINVAFIDDSSPQIIGIEGGRVNMFKDMVIAKLDSTQSNADRLLFISPLSALRISQAFLCGADINITTLGSIYGGNLILLQSSNNVFASKITISLIEFKNYGTIQYRFYSDIFLSEGAQFINELGATLNADPYYPLVDLKFTGGDLPFQNLGTLLVQVSSTNHFECSSLQNDGIVNVINGTLLLPNGGTHSGIFTTDSGNGAIIQFLGSVNHTFSTKDPFINGPGIIFNGPTINIESTFFTSSFELVFGVVNFNSEFYSVPDLSQHIIQWTGGVINFFRDALIGELRISANGSSIFVSSTASLSIGSSLKWNGNGIISVMEDSSSTNLILQAYSVNQIYTQANLRNVSLINSGTLQVISPGNLKLDGISTITNGPDGIFIATGSTSNSLETGSFSFINQGIFSVNMDSGVNFTISNLQNDGITQVQSGIVSVVGDSIHTGSFFTNGTAGAQLIFVGTGNVQFRSTDTFVNGPGIVFNGPTVNISNPYFTTSFVLQMGVVNFNSIFTSVPSIDMHIIDWVGGDLNFFFDASIGSLLHSAPSSSVLTINTKLIITKSLVWNGQGSIQSQSANSQIELSYSSNTTITTSAILNMRFLNYGQLRLLSSIILALNSSLINTQYGTIITSGVSVSDNNDGTYLVLNQGAIIVEDDTTFTTALQNNGSIISNFGTLSLQHPSIMYHSGSFYANTSATIEFISGTHFFSANSVFNGPGTIEFGGAYVIINGNFASQNFSVTAGVVLFQSNPIYLCSPNIQGGDIYFNATVSIQNFAPISGNVTFLRNANIFSAEFNSPSLFLGPNRPCIDYATSYAGCIYNNVACDNETSNCNISSANYCLAGCTDLGALNYDPNAIYNDGSCKFSLTSGNFVTTGRVTTSKITTARMTTGRVTSGRVTSGSLTTGRITSGKLTTAPLIITTGSDSESFTTGSGGIQTSAGSSTLSGDSTSTSSDKNSNDNNSSSTAVAATVSVLIIIAIIIATIVIVYFIRKSKGDPKESQSSFNPTKSTSEEVSLTDMNSSYDSISRIRKPPESDSSGVLSSAAIDFTEITLEDKLGEGASGEVYKAKWRGAKVAVKLLAQVAKNNFKEFEKEAVLMAKLRSHPNVVSFLGFCVEPIAIVISYCPGGSLYTLIHSNKDIKRKTLTTIVHGIVAGMTHLHSEKIVHRDLAARNVLLTESFEAKVSDFGLARVSETTESKTSSLVGPLKHMAPECLMHGKYSDKSDIWAFGVTLFEVFERKEPYEGMSALEAASQVVSSQPIRLQPPTFMSEEMKQIFTSCFSVNPADRPSFIKISSKITEIKLFG